MRYFATRIPAALLTFVVGVAAVGGAREWSQTPEERAVLAVEREYVRAHVERDVAALERVLADDFSMFGGRVKKDTWLLFLRSEIVRITSLETSDVEVVVDGNQALVTGTEKLSGRVRGREFTTPRYGFTRHFEKRRGRWQVVSSSLTLPW